MPVWAVFDLTPRLRFEEAAGEAAVEVPKAEGGTRRCQARERRRSGEVLPAVIGNSLAHVPQPS